jgi:hypothetical protein
VTRCNSSGTSDDLGEYCKVTAYWSVNRTYDQNNTGTITGTISEYGTSSSTSISFTGTTQGASGSVTAIVPGIDTDKQYSITARLTDTNTDAHHASTTTRTVILTRAKFILDFRAGGNAMGIGSAAAQSGLTVGYDTTFNGDVTFNDTIDTRNASWLSTYSSNWAGGGNYDISYVFTAASGFSGERLTYRTCGPMRMVYLQVTGSVTSGSWHTLGTVVSAYRPQFMDAPFACSCGFGYIDTNGNVKLYAVESRSIIDISATFI